MKKFLIILWIIIIGGITFLLINPFGKTPSTNPPETQEEEVTDNLPADKTFNEYITAGDQYFAAKNYKLAIRNYKLASQKSPNSSRAFYKLGQAYQENAEPDNSLSAFQQAEKLNQNSLSIKLALVQSYLDLNKIAEAKELVWQLDRENSQVKYYTGMILVLYKDFDQAKEFFTQIAADESGAPDDIKQNSKEFLKQYETFADFTEAEQIFLQTMLAKTLTEIDQNYLAIPLLFDVISQKNNYRDAWVILGYAYLKTDQINESIDALLQAEALDSEKAQTLFFLGVAYEKSGDNDKASYYIERADRFGFEPKDEINFRLGNIYADQKDYEKSAQKYEQVISVNPDNMDVFIRLVWLYIDKLDQPEKALQVANQAIRYHPQEAMSYNLKGWTLTALGNYEEAKTNLEKAISYDENLDAAYLNLGILYEEQNQSAFAKEYYKKAYIIGNGSTVSKMADERLKNLTLQISNPK